MIFFVLQISDDWNASDLKKELPDAEPFVANLGGVLTASEWKDFKSDRLYLCLTWLSGPSLFWGFDLTQPPQVGSTVSIPDAYWQGSSECIVSGAHYESSNCIIVDLKLLEG